MAFTLYLLSFLSSNNCTSSIDNVLNIDAGVRFIRLAFHIIICSYALRLVPLFAFLP